jgi:regulator of replication initiation timing
MKKYQQLLGMLQKIEAKYLEISDIRDDLFEKINMETKRQDEYEKYDEKLRDQQLELVAREKPIVKQLEWVEGNNTEWTVRFDDDGLYFRYKVIDLSEMPRFIGWLELMNSEVE